MLITSRTTEKTTKMVGITHPRSSKCEGRGEIGTKNNFLGQGNQQSERGTIER